MAVGASASAVADGRLLHQDPFARPALATQAASVRGPGSGGVESAPAWSPQLVAVVVAGSDSLVNIDGAIVRMGEEIDGHRLVAVREEEAVFLQGNKRTVLRMRTALKQDRERGRP